VKLQVWDTAGQERFRAIQVAYYRGAHGVMVVYSVTDQRSYQNVQNWLRVIEQNANSNIARVLVGNKCDSLDRREVEKHVAAECANTMQIRFFETSAKSCIGVEDAFMQLAREGLKNLDQQLVESTVESVVTIAPVNDKNKKKKRGC